MFHRSGLAGSGAAVHGDKVHGGPDKVHRAGPGPVHGLRISTNGVLDPPRQPFAEGSERRGRRGSVSSLLSGFLGNRPASKTREGRGIRLEQQSQQRLIGSQCGFVYAQDMQAARGRAASMDARVLLTIRPVSQVHPRPSPLGCEKPLAGRVGHTRKLSDQAPPCSATDRSLAGIGAQHGAELPRSSTVSPALSVTSDAAGARLEGAFGRDEVPVHASEGESRGLSGPSVSSDEANEGGPVWTGPQSRDASDRPELMRRAAVRGPLSPLRGPRHKTPGRSRGPGGRA